jgi:superfamily II DNA or RNA helicase
MWVRKGGRFFREPIAVYALRTNDNSEFRFHINDYQNFIEFLALNNVQPNNYEVVQYPPDVAVDFKFELRPKFVPYPEQIPVIDYLVSPEPSKAKLLEIQTGKGKGLMSMAAMCKIGKRTAVVVKGGFVKKWTEELVEKLELTKDQITEVQGSAALMEVIAAAKSGQEINPVLIFSSRTLLGFYKEYRQHGDAILQMGYDCTPPELFNTLGIGLRIIDEVHLDFHMHFKTDLYTNTEYTISLSATLRHDQDAFIDQMYQVAYPDSMRFRGLAYDKYVFAYAFLYNLTNPLKIRTTAWGSNQYSQVEYEKSICSKQELLDDYLMMIYSSVKNFFLDKDYVEGDKLLIYCGSVHMCGLVVDYLKEQIQGKDIRRYAGSAGDPYENLLDPEICVTTLLSAGTGHDIKGLTTVIFTVGIRSSQSNVQGFGRLRKVTGRKLKFIYMVCADIPKHMLYHEVKKKLLERIALNYKSITYPKPLG